MVSFGTSGRLGAIENANADLGPYHHALARLQIQRTQIQDGLGLPAARQRFPHVAFSLVKAASLFLFADVDFRLPALRDFRLAVDHK